VEQVKAQQNDRIFLRAVPNLHVQIIEVTGEHARTGDEACEALEKLNFVLGSETSIAAALGASISGRFASGNRPIFTAGAYLRTAESRCAVPHLLKTPRFSYTISATPAKRLAAPHGNRRICAKGRWPLPTVDSGALAASQPCPPCSSRP
jgi:hypothetical protein